MKNVLDLFCGGCGGWSLGFHRAGFNTIAACEVDEWRRARFSNNFPNARMYDDVRTLTAARLRADGVGHISAVIGSPPCQDASAANSIKGGQGVDGTRTGLFFDAIRLVGELGPDWACFENVPPLRTRGYDRVQDGLEAIGYAVRPLVVGAACAGAPHLRQRVWIIANSKMLQWPAIEGHQPDRDHAPAAADPAQEPGRTRPDFPFAQSALGGWQDWNGGASHFERMDDGLPAGMARQLLAAYGDAVVPQIPEIIGRFIASTYH